MPIPHYLPHSSLQQLFEALTEDGYAIVGPQAKENRIDFGEIRNTAELPWGIGLIQDAGASQLVDGPKNRCFAWANGPQAMKPLLFAPREPLWQIRHGKNGYVVDAINPETRRLAVIGLRPCDLSALRIQDQHFLEGQYPDSHYGARREGLLVIAVNCTHPAATCFCASTGDGPGAKESFDIALTEDDNGFVVETGSPEGEQILARLALKEALSTQMETAADNLRNAASSQRRSLVSDNLRDVLMSRLDHPHWDEVAERCLACGNCTAVCPTCFCHAEIEEASLGGNHSLHSREWDSCFGERHGYIHGKQLRPEIKQRYRQWLTHKLATWHDQFGRSGCVGCGRCIACCPVGIDITEEAAALLK